MADGQVTRNTEIVKPNVKKVRTMIDGSVIGGFAGDQPGPMYSVLALRYDAWEARLTCNTPRALSDDAGATADAFTLFERLESQLEAHPGDLSSQQCMVCPAHSTCACATSAFDVSACSLCAQAS